MARSQLRGTQIEDNSLTGADLYFKSGVYDETHTYNQGDRVLWMGRLYEATATVSGLEAGNFTHSPEVYPYWQELSQDYNVLMYSVGVSTAQTFTTTPIVVGFDTELVPSDWCTVSNGEVTILKDITVFVSVSIDIDIANTSTSRTVSETKLQLDSGSGYTDVDNFEIALYHRRYRYAKTSSTCIVPISFLTGNKIRVRSVRRRGSAQLTTVPEGCVLNLFAIKGLKGDKGDKGDPGNMRWAGSWQPQYYAQYDLVEYQGSSYICLQDAPPSSPPTDTNYWELVASKGEDGTGSSITILEDDTVVSGTPHNRLNFTGQVDVANNTTVSGQADIKILRQLPIWYLSSGYNQVAYPYEVHNFTGSILTQEDNSTYFMEEGAIIVL